VISCSQVFWERMNSPLRSAGTKNFFLSISGILDLGTFSTITWWSKRDTITLTGTLLYTPTLLHISKGSRFGGQCHTGDSVRRLESSQITVNDKGISAHNHCSLILRCTVFSYYFNLLGCDVKGRKVVERTQLSICACNHTNEREAIIKPLRKSSSFKR